uniref:AGC-kinase C-terminal domain-containing protein n=1 Tax=Anopheles epiroticus TaxID=199890 RepID=A0A182P500_9DIPT
MKILAMADVIRLKQIEHVKNEKNILQEIDHPFIVNMRWNSKDDCCLYMLFEFVSGGVLIYEMIVGYPPFYDDNPFGIYEKILSGKIEWSRHVDPIAKDLVKKLLVLDRTKRLGNMKNGAEDVKRHRWFKHLDWNVVIRKQLKPPIVPTYVFSSKEDDTSNFDDYPETDWKSVRSLDKIEMQLFEDF